MGEERGVESETRCLLVGVQKTVHCTAQFPREARGVGVRAQKAHGTMKGTRSNARRIPLGGRVATPCVPLAGAKSRSLTSPAKV